MICIIDLPQAVDSSGQQYVLSKHDFDKITTLVNQPWLWDGSILLFKGTLMHIKFYFFLNNRLLLKTD